MNNKIQLSLFTTNVSTEKLPTNFSGNHHKVQRWGNFIAGFSIEFAQKSILSRSKNGLILDPFLGCGTTIAAARSLGLESVGYDPHPVFNTISRAKSERYTALDVDKIDNIFKEASNTIEISQSAQKFLDKLFKPDTLSRLLCASNEINNLDNHLKPLAVAIFLRTAEISCSSQTDGIYKAPTSGKIAKSYRTSLKLAIDDFYQDISSDWYQKEYSKTPAKVLLKSSTLMEELSDKTVGAVITSPPYLNNFDFAEMTRMQLYLLGWASSWGDITDKVRLKLITNTTTSLKIDKSPNIQLKYRESLPQNLLKEIDPLISSLKEERSLRAGKKAYYLTVYPYYGSIFSVLKECKRVMKDGATISWIVSDAALYGHYVETQQHTAMLMRSIGFSDVNIKCLRKRGHKWKLKKRDGAPGRLGEYLITARS